MKPRNNNKTWKSPIKVFIIFLVLFCILILQFGYISLFPNLYGINMKKFATNRNTVSTKLRAFRGGIYDSQGNPLAINVTSYTVIAYLSPSRTGNSSRPRHVVDVEATAQALSPILNMSEETLKGLLSRNVYQVELGPGGRGITEVKKKQIEDLELPGIGFVESQKRYYPNGDFASYIIGYAKKNDDDEIVGELGIESKYNIELKGTDGYLKYQRNNYGYKIPDTPEERVEAINGKNIYLTIDSGVQRFLEDAIKTSNESYSSEWMLISVMDAKTGKILGSATSPSYKPNILNIKNYENPLVTYQYEPGSTMKIFSYMCLMENGTYDGEEKYMSGSITTGNNTISDWERKGWGLISYDLGFEYSSNVAVSTMVKKGELTKDMLHECYEKYGFGKKTDIELSREMPGKLTFSREVEVMAAAYGQGIWTTPIQHLQALTMLANDGVMLKPYIIEKIVDPNTNEIVFEGKKQELGQIVSKQTTDKMKELMYNVIYGKNPGTTGGVYKIDGLDIIGKTGTAQIYENGAYIKNYIYSFSGMYPKDDPKVIIYGAVKKPSTRSARPLFTAVKDLMQNMAKYYNINGTGSNKTNLNEYKVDNYINKNTQDVVNDLKDKNLKLIVLGDGDKIINQYPLKDSRVVEKDKIILLTNSEEIKMPSIIGFSKLEVQALMDLLKIQYEINGYGYVKEQSVKPGEIVKKDTIITIDLEDKYILNEIKTEDEEKTTE